MRSLLLAHGYEGLEATNAWECYANSAWNVIKCDIVVGFYAAGVGLVGCV